MKDYNAYIDIKRSELLNWKARPPVPPNCILVSKVPGASYTLVTPGITTTDGHAVRHPGFQARLCFNELGIKQAIGRLKRKLGLEKVVTV